MADESEGGASEEILALRRYREIEERVRAALARQPQDLHEITEAYLEFVQAKAPPTLRQVHPAPPARDVTPEEAEKIYRELSRK
jgi:hypothetical protein